jgi:hypothetical protein
VRAPSCGLTRWRGNAALQLLTTACSPLCACSDVFNFGAFAGLCESSDVVSMSSVSEQRHGLEAPSPQRRTTLVTFAAATPNKAIVDYTQPRDLFDLVRAVSRPVRAPCKLSRSLFCFWNGSCNPLAARSSATVPRNGHSDRHCRGMQNAFFCSAETCRGCRRHAPWTRRVGRVRCAHARRDAAERWVHPDTRCCCSRVHLV